MTPNQKDAREAQIAEAAYGLLREKGYGGMSMLAVARRARASNETLYRWYGDKAGLFGMLIARNVARVADRLDQMADGGGGSLVELGECLLEMLLSPSAIALNRAAAADSGNQLGALLAEGGRGQVMPRIVTLFAGLLRDGAGTVTPQEAAEIWLSLLLGDVQLRCVTGAMDPPDAAARQARAQRAERLVWQLCGGSQAVSR